MSPNLTHAFYLGFRHRVSIKSSSYWWRLTIGFGLKCNTSRLKFYVQFSNNIRQGTYTTFNLFSYFRYTFVGERWLSVEDTIDAKLSSSAEDVPVSFETRFFFQTRGRLSESHMWVSIAYRPETSTFTRVQRATCALVYIFLTMIANAMYYNPAPDYEAPALLQVGPLRFTSQQVQLFVVFIHLFKVAWESGYQNLKMYTSPYWERSHIRTL